MAEEKAISIGENNPFFVSDIKREIVAVKSIVPESESTIVVSKSMDKNSIPIDDVKLKTNVELFESNQKKYNDEKTATLQKKEQQSLALQKKETPKYIVTLEEKKTFLSVSSGSTGQRWIGTELFNYYKSDC